MEVGTLLTFNGPSKVEEFVKPPQNNKDTKQSSQKTQLVGGGYGRRSGPGHD